MKTLKVILKIITNKFVITGIAFGVWTLFFDQNDWLTLREKANELKALKANIAYLNGEIAKMNREKDALNTNAKVLEQYARENYRMKRDNEDVYVIEKTK
jgi:cell division protein DivIC